MIEAVAHDVDVDAFLEGERRPGVAGAVELEPWKRLVGMGSVVGGLLPEELAAEALGVGRGAIGAREDRAARRSRWCGVHGGSRSGAGEW